MSSYIKDLPLGWSLALVAGALAIAFGVQANAPTIYPVEKGAELLKSQGYTHVTGGEQKFFAWCGKGNYAREFEGIKNDHTEKATVCYNMFGVRRPAFENK